MKIVYFLDIGAKRIDKITARINIHSLRHLNATLLINSGADIRTTSAALGHSNTTTTLNIYAHTFEEAQAKASEAVADIFKFGGKEKK